MKKHVNTFDLEKGLRVIWDVFSAMDVTQLGDNLFMFEFQDNRACDRIFNKQPWNYRGSLVLIESIRGDECPTNFNIIFVPFRVQVHGLQIRAMTKSLRRPLEPYSVV